MSGFHENEYIETLEFSWTHFVKTREVMKPGIHEAERFES